MGNNAIVQRPSNTRSGLVILDTDKQREDIESKYIVGTSIYNQINENVILKTENQIKRIVENIYYNEFKGI